MSDEDICAIGVDANWQHARAQACLDLFEKDCGRRAATPSEVCAWASAQKSRATAVQGATAPDGGRTVGLGVQEDLERHPGALGLEAAEGPADIFHPRRSGSGDRPERVDNPDCNQARPDHRYQGHPGRLAYRARPAAARVSTVPERGGGRGVVQRRSARCGGPGSRARDRGAHQPCRRYSPRAPSVVAAARQR